MFSIKRSVVLQITKSLRRAGYVLDLYDIKDQNSIYTKSMLTQYMHSKMSSLSWGYYTYLSIELMEQVRQRFN